MSLSTMVVFRMEVLSYQAVMASSRAAFSHEPNHNERGVHGRGGVNSHRTPA
jgi:hypothetical protein